MTDAPKVRLPRDQPRQTPAHAQMSFGEHLEELRRRLVLALLGSLVGIGVCMFFSADIIREIFAPYVLALRYAGYPFSIIYPHPADAIIAYIMLGLKAGLLVSSPWIIYQAWLFIAAGLYPRERKLVYRYIGPSAALFLAGAAFFFFLVLPLMLWIFLSFNAKVPATNLRPNPWEAFLFQHGNAALLNPADYPAATRKNVLLVPILRTNPPGQFRGHVALWFNATDDVLKMRIGKRTLNFMLSDASSLFTPFLTLDDYLGFVTLMTLVFGIAFELPMAMMVVAQLGLVEAATFRRFWRHAMLGVALLSVILAPTPDAFTFLALFLPLVGLYLLGLLLAHIATRHRSSEPTELEDVDDTFV